MCDCRKILEAKLTERFEKSSPEATGHKVTLQGYAICLGEQLSSRSFMPYKATAVFPLKKGGTRVKNEEGSMFFSHCSFCGEKQQP